MSLSHGPANAPMVHAPQDTTATLLAYHAWHLDNYSKVLKEIVPGWDGMCAFFTGRRAGDMIPDLELIVATCGTERDPDYWNPTRGNVGAIMATILEWCRLHPDAVFDTWC